MSKLVDSLIKDITDSLSDDACVTVRSSGKIFVLSCRKSVTSITVWDKDVSKQHLYTELSDEDFRDTLGNWIISYLNNQGEL